ncbi:MAG: hypothetical protein ACP5D7_07640 [Limnospira sp.]
MIESEILKKIQGTSIEERILIIEAILKTVKKDMRSRQLSSQNKPLHGKVIHYDNPYEPVAIAQSFRL